MDDFGLKEHQTVKLHNCFRKFPTIEKVIVYGSRAKGNYRPGSDIDLAIIDHKMTWSDLLALENNIDDLLLPYKIDISLLRNLENEQLLDHIQRVGKYFYEKK